MVTLSLTSIEVRNIMQVYVNQEDIKALDESVVIEDILMFKKFYDNTKGITKEFVKKKIIDYSNEYGLTYVSGLPRFLKPKVKK